MFLQGQPKFFGAFKGVPSFCGFLQSFEGFTIDGLFVFAKHNAIIYVCVPFHMVSLNMYIFCPVVPLIGTFALPLKITGSVICPIIVQMVHLISLPYDARE
tara:strand:- start:723 stop:1025 length:303 start_codon:yes stop_codon:yes gene_type:complete